jgi:SAM-dependent methyltransferase
MTDAAAPTPGAHVSEQWARWRATVDLDEYESRFTHDAAHGEADAITRLGATRVLDAGCGTGRVAIELHRRGIEVCGVDLDDDLLALARRKAPEVTWVCADLATLRLGRTFDLVAMPGNVLLFCRPSDRSPIIHACAAHLEPGGLLVAGFSLRPGEIDLDVYDAAASAAGLAPVERWATWSGDPYAGGDYAVSIHRLPHAR